MVTSPGVSGYSTNVDNDSSPTGTVPMPTRQPVAQSPVETPPVAVTVTITSFAASGPLLGTLNGNELSAPARTVVLWNCETINCKSASANSVVDPNAMRAASN